MTIYKFRVMYEEDDSIFRDIEIKPSQTLSDFESIIVSSYSLPANSSGQFFRSNDNWQHLKPIIAVPQPQEIKKGKAKAKAQTLPILVAYIDDPHQKFIYEYHGSQEFVFLVELMSLTGAEKSNVMYPLCVRQQGPSPFKKEDLVAHYSKAVEIDNEEEEHVIDDEEDDIESMNREGDAEETEVEAAVEDVEESAEEADVDSISEEDEVPEEEEFGEGFAEETGDDLV